jgi:hypothetical protein
MMKVKRVKTRQDLIAFKLATNERLKNRGALRAWILPLDAIMSVGLTQRSTAALHLCGADLRFRIYDDGHVPIS